ncbi:MAG: phosphatidylserine decarboxylase family protein [Desulfobacterales bacterium]|nr:phosphatidylserine decarboxylase family protein [Desulfobacterales bacterium]
MDYRFNRVDPPQTSALPVANAGYPFIGAAAFCTFVFALLEIAWLAILGLIATFFITYFFRDPERFVPSPENAVVSPADGRVVQAEVVDQNPFIEGRCLKIGIFMSIFNVHVNRIPYTGTIENTIYKPGKFVSADKAAASLQNEQQALVLETEKGQKIGFVQIAGLVARRIICRVQPGDAVSRGERFGMICFGSRLDVYLPAEASAEVAKGDKVKAGQSIIGYLE